MTLHRFSFCLPQYLSYPSWFTVAQPELHNFIYQLPSFLCVSGMQPKSVCGGVRFQVPHFISGSVEVHVCLDVFVRHWQLFAHQSWNKHAASYTPLTYFLFFFKSCIKIPCSERKREQLKVVASTKELHFISLLIFTSCCRQAKLLQSLPTQNHFQRRIFFSFPFYRFGIIVNGSTMVTV